MASDEETMKECEECGGDGCVSCDECGGTGEITCSTCDGEGEVEK